MKALFYKYQITKYSNRLPFYVMAENGVKSHYSCREIDLAIKKWSFNKRYSFIGYAMLSTEECFDSHVRNQALSYKGIRQDIADIKFYGDISFTTCDILSESIFKVGQADTCGAKGDRSFANLRFKCSRMGLYKLKKDPYESVYSAVGDGKVTVNCQPMGNTEDIL